MGAFNPRSPETAAAICAARSDTVREVILYISEMKTDNGAEMAEDIRDVKDIKKKIVYCFVEKKNWLEFRNWFGGKRVNRNI